MIELRRCVELLDGECTMKDGSNADTFAAHNLLGDFNDEAYHSMMNGPRIRQSLGVEKSFVLDWPDGLPPQTEPPQQASAPSVTSSDSSMQALPRLNIKCETVGVVMIGSTSLKVIRVEAEDDGSFTAVTDHWPDNGLATWRESRPLSELLDDKSKGQLKMILDEEPDANMGEGNPADYGD